MPDTNATQATNCHHEWVRSEHALESSHCVKCGVDANEGTTKARMIIEFDASTPLRWADVFDVLSVMVQRQKTEGDTFECIYAAEAEVRGVTCDLRAKWWMEL